MSRAGIFKPLWSPGIDAKASIPPAYVAWRAGTITLIPTRCLAPIDFLKIPALCSSAPSLPLAISEPQPPTLFLVTPSPWHSLR
jgi:hypothetical protein